MNDFIDGSWGLFRRAVSPAGGLCLNLSAREIELLKGINDRTLDYFDDRCFIAIRGLIRKGLVTSAAGRLPEIADPGKRILGLLGIIAFDQQEPLQNVG